MWRRRSRGSRGCSAHEPRDKWRWGESWFLASQKLRQLIELYRFRTAGLAWNQLKILPISAGSAAQSAFPLSLFSNLILFSSNSINNLSLSETYFITFDITSSILPWIFFVSFWMFTGVDLLLPMHMYCHPPTSQTTFVLSCLPLHLTFHLFPLLYVFNHLLCQGQQADRLQVDSPRYHWGCHKTSTSFPVLLCASLIFFGTPDVASHFTSTLLPTLVSLLC